MSTTRPERDPNVAHLGTPVSSVYVDCTGSTLDDGAPPRMLDQLSQMADHADRLAAKLTQMLGRFHEPPAPIKPDDTTAPAYGRGYGEEIRRLRVNLQGIDEALEHLDSLA